MNIELLKWMCEKADGFGWMKSNENNEFYHIITTPNGKEKDPEDIDRDDECYPLLLQRAIEGVFREENYFIDIEYYDKKWLYRVFMGEYPDSDNFLHIEKGLSIDAAKAAALEYVWEQERKHK